MSEFSTSDCDWMAQAIALAAQGLGQVAPNPPVGCVLVKEGVVVGQGWHQRCGQPHAEVNAIADAGQNAFGSTAYVTLMPCNHTGRTGPCTEALIAAGVKKVVVAVDDPNPESGNGAARLTDAGIEVAVGCLRQKTAYGMRGFLKTVATGLPFVTYKYAMTLDGKTATHAKDSKWISSGESRAQVQAMRSEVDAILVGPGTARADDPRLNVRAEGAHQPWRVIVDAGALVSSEARVFTEPGGPVLVLCGLSADPKAVARLAQRGATVVPVEEKMPGRLDLSRALNALTQKGIHTILTEGGAGFAGALLDQKLIDEVVAFVAPRIAGSHAAPGAFGGDGVAMMKEAHCLSHVEHSVVGGDFCIRGRLGDWPWL